MPDIKFVSYLIFKVFNKDFLSHLGMSLQTLSVCVAKYVLFSTLKNVQQRNTVLLLEIQFIFIQKSQ